MVMVDKNKMYLKQSMVDYIINKKKNMVYNKSMVHTDKIYNKSMVDTDKMG